MLIIPFAYYFLTLLQVSETRNPLHVFQHSGLIFQQRERVIISEGPITFNVNIRYLFPTLNISKLSECNVKQKKIKEIEELRASLFDSVLSEFHLFLGQNTSSKDVEIFSHAILYDHRRSRRAFRYLSDNYFTLSGWTEKSLHDLKSWSSGFFNTTTDRVNQMSVLLNQESDALSDFELKLCNSERSEPEIDFKRALGQTLAKMSADLSQAEDGSLPLSVSDTFLVEFCEKHFRQNSNSKICQLNIRPLLNVVDTTLFFDDKVSSIILGLNIEIPNTPVLEYEVLHFGSIPIFIGQQAFQVSLSNSFLVVNTENHEHEESVTFDARTCEKRGRFKICSERSRPRNEFCLRVAWKTKSLPKDCQLTPVPGHHTCFWHKITDGYVISSANVLKVHTNPLVPTAEVFEAKLKELNGIGVLRSNSKVIRSVMCDGRMVRTQASKRLEPYNITIVGLSGENSTENLVSIPQNLTFDHFANLSRYNNQKITTIYDETIPFVIKMVKFLFSTFGVTLLIFKIWLVYYCFHRIRAKRTARRFNP